MPQKEIKLNDVGDIEVGYDGDIACVYDDDVTVQGILWRLQTFAGDYELYPQCGASLELFVGVPNTADSGVSIEKAVYDALTHDGFLGEEEFTIRVSPISTTSVIISIDSTGEYGNYRVLAQLNLLTGQLSTKY